MFGDGTSFGDLDVKTIINELQRVGYESYGNEVMYDGLTGQRSSTKRFLPTASLKKTSKLARKQTLKAKASNSTLSQQPATAYEHSSLTSANYVAKHPAMHHKIIRIASNMRTETQTQPTEANLSLITTSK